MVAYDYSKEPNNPWDTATWSPKAQVDFSRRMRSLWLFNGSADARIRQRIAESDTKGVPPKKASAMPPYQIIVQRRFLGAQTPPASTPPPPPPVVGFGQSGKLEDAQQFSLAVAPFKMFLPGATPSEARCDVAPTSNAILTLVNSMGGTLCTVEFLAGSKVGTFSWSSPAMEVDPGDVLFVIGPATADSTLAGVNIAFVGALTAP